MGRLKDILSEAKQVGTLYHYTDIVSLLKILDSNKLGDYNKKGELDISLTRDKNFHHRTYIIPTEACLVLDGNKLSNNYKITPYDYFGDLEQNPDKFGAELSNNPENKYRKQQKGSYKTGEFQAEETVKGPIFDVDKYIIKIILFELDLDYLIGEEYKLKQIAYILDIEPDQIVPTKDIPQFIENMGYEVEIKR